MRFFDKDKQKENKKRHAEYRSYYWKKQINTIFNMSVLFLFMCVAGFFFAVPFEHANYPDLGRLKYGVSIAGQIVFACFSKWLLETKCMSESKKAVAAEIFTFVLSLLYLCWGILGMEVAIIEYSTPVILVYIILLAVVTAFLYLPLHHFVILVMITYSLAGACFHMHRDVPIDITSSICAVIMMITLGVLSNTRYIYGRDRFEFERRNFKLIDEKDEQNAELEAQNEELIAINQELNDTSDKLSNALKELEDASEAQKRFTYSMNHELRAPLNGIIGTIQVILMNDKLAESDRHYIDQCMVMSKSLLNIVNDLLDFAKMDAGEFEILTAPFDLHDVIEGIESTFKNLAENKGLKLNIEIPDDTVCGLYGDDFRIQQMIANIVSNGVKYTEKGSVTVKVAYTEDKLKFVISDTGQGMSEESLKYLFMPFKRIEESKNKKIQGTGLGMTIVKNLVEQMEGTISVESIVGSGTTFTIIIPSKITDKNNTWSNPVKKIEVNKTDVPANIEGKRILYVDDMKINLKIVEKLLSDTGVEVKTTENPSEGLKLAIDNSYDIIMVDHQMPDMTGPELFAEIRKNSTVNVNTPVIIFTGNAGNGTEEKYKEMGFSGYLCKPVLKDKLVEMIKRVAEI